MTFQIIDMHCDVLSKMLVNPELQFRQDERLDVTLARLQAGHVKAQCFAIFLADELGQLQFKQVLHSIHAMYNRVLNHPEMRLIQTSEDWRELQTVPRQIGALLSLEGVDALEGDLSYLHICYLLGVRLVGFTWNHANWAADGIMEARAGGFTAKGKQLIQLCDQLQLIMDVSHLSVRGFWELTEQTSTPFIASHSNAKMLMNHPRNLSDEQIQAIIARNGRIGTVFYPPFVSTKPQAYIEDVIAHIEHICALGGKEHVMLGSDFDGIDQRIVNLEHPGHFEQLYNALSRRYASNEVDGFLYRNASNFLEQALPSRTAANAGN